MDGFLEAYLPLPYPLLCQTDSRHSGEDRDLLCVCEA